jgi:hypothetical protein
MSMSLICVGGPVSSYLLHFLKLFTRTLTSITGHVVIDYRDRIIVARLTVVDDDCAAAHLVMEVRVLGLF